MAEENVKRRKKGRIVCGVSFIPAHLTRLDRAADALLRRYEKQADVPPEVLAAV